MPWLLLWKHWHLLVSLVYAPALVLSDSVVEPADRLIGDEEPHHDTGKKV